MSVALQTDSESVREEVETEYRHDDHEVPDKLEAGLPSASMYASEFCCGYSG
ncbi:hypothetical protein [Halorussus litoreus]|uniref:hypothetical protein n=1 Tax=Halorussus litoreus TaxID=1710536 RepID=UPI0013008352|nr:hypothetical protein [Halorussus litoreus]